MMNLKMILFYFICWHKKRINQTHLQSGFSPVVLSFQVLILTSNIITYRKSKLKLDSMYKNDKFYNLYILIILFTYFT